MKKFTLIELLVVIAIIGILSSILMPALSKARLKTQQAFCLNNHKQLTTASISYSTDNDEFMPTWSSDANWRDKLLLGYIDESSTGNYSPIFRCPNGTKYDSYGKGSIAMNKQFTGNEFNLNPQSTTKASSTETVLLMDAYKWWATADYSQMDVSKVLDQNTEYRIARH